MDLHLSPEAQRFVEAQLQSGGYHSVSEVIESLVQARAASEPAGNGQKSIPVKLAASQAERLLQVVRECEALGGAPPTDGFTNRDHDRALYTERS